MPKKNIVKTKNAAKNKGTIITVAPKKKKKSAQNTSAADGVMEFLSSVDMAKPVESAGEQLGRKLGKFAGRLLGKIAGSGDYESDLPPGGLPISDTQVPEFIKTTNNRETRLRHREFIGNVYASNVAGAFTNATYPLNPGNELLFPWLSGIAQHFDSWEPNGVVVIFKSLTSTYAASQSLGTVVIASDYDVYDPPYLSKIEMENSEFAVSGSAAQNLMHPVECKPSERMTKLFNTRVGPIGSNDNKRFFDLCNVQVASEGCLANQLLGELWVTYDISLYKPQLPLNPNAAGVPQYCFTSASLTANSPFSGILAFSPYNTADFCQPSGVNSLRFSDRYAGYYFLVQIRWANVSDATSPGTSVLTGISTIPDMWTLAYNKTPTVSTLGQSMVWQAYIRIDDAVDDIHVMNITTPACALGGAGRYSIMVTVSQVTPNSFNFGEWAGLP